MKNMPRLYTPSELAEILDLSVATIYAALSRKELKGFHQGRRRVITSDQLVEYMGKRGAGAVRNHDYSRKEMR